MTQRDSAVNCELWSPLSACITCFQPKLTLMKHIFRIVYSFFTNRKLEYLFNIFLCNILNYYFAWLIVNQALGKIKTKYNVILSPSVYYILLYSIQHLIPIQKSFNAKLEWILWQQFNPRLLKRIINHCLPVLPPWKNAWAHIWMATMQKTKRIQSFCKNDQEFPERIHLCNTDGCSQHLNFSRLQFHFKS